MVKIPHEIMRINPPIGVIGPRNLQEKGINESSANK
jgi:hypothetical protein